MIWLEGIDAIGCTEAAATLGRPLNASERAAVRTAIHAMVAHTLLIPAHATEQDYYEPAPIAEVVALDEVG